MMILKTERLTLRPWRESDAEALYEYARDERVGPIAGWPPHTSVEQSREVIKNMFMNDGIFAITLKGDDKAIGLAGLTVGKESNFEIGDNEGEVSYWIGVPFWGNGYVPEAIEELIRYGFEELGLKSIWAGHADGNEQSKRVQEKCGLGYLYTEHDVEFDLIDTVRTEHIRRITKRQWTKRRTK